MEIEETKGLKEKLQKTVTEYTNLVHVCNDILAYFETKQHHKKFSALLHADTDTFQIYSTPDRYSEGKKRVIIYSRKQAVDGVSFIRNREILHTSINTVDWYPIITRHINDYKNSYQQSADNAVISLNMVDSLVIDHIAIKKHLERLRTKYAPLRSVVDSGLANTFQLLLKSGNLYIN